MKIISVFAALLLTTSLYAANETNGPAQVKSEQAEAKILKVYVGKDGEAESRSYVVLWKDQEVIVGDLTAETNCKEGETIKFMVMHLPHRRNGKGALMFQILPARPSIPVIKTVVRVVQNQANHTVFFECRGEELFCVEKDDLEAQVAQSRPGVEIGNASYIVNPSSLAAGVISLEPRPNVHGDRAADLNDPASKFQKALQRLNRQEDNLIIMVREDSAGLGDKARQIAAAAGFTATVHPWAKDKSLRFSTAPAHPPAP